MTRPHYVKTFIRDTPNLFFTDISDILRHVHIFRYAEEVAVAFGMEQLVPVKISTRHIDAPDAHSRLSLDQLNPLPATTL